jgi:hypothetical protein
VVLHDAITVVLLSLDIRTGERFVDGTLIRRPPREEEKAA